MSSHAIHELLTHYGLAAVFLATFGQALFLPIPGSTFVIAASVYAASRHGLPIVGVFLAALAGVTLGGLGGFLIGRWRGERVLLALGRRLRQPPERIGRLREALDRHAVIALLAARWFTGTRNLAGIASGASAMSLTRFSLITFVSAVVWAAITCVEFFFFGSLFLRAPTWLKALIIVLGIASTFAILVLVRRRARGGPELARG